MKKSIVFLAIVAALSFSAMSCGNKEESKTDATNEVASKNDVSYAFGVAIGMSLKDTGVELEYGKFLEGVKDVVEKDNPKIALEDVQTTIQLAITEAMQKIAARNIELETDFLSKNGKKTGVTTTPSGLQYEVITMGSGPKPLETDTVRVDYVGTFIDGKEFDSSIKGGEPAVFPVAMVIPGWVEGIQLMPVGSKYKFYIPSALAYGEQGSQGGIQPNTMLIFEVELLGIEAEAQ
ncbi:MAG: FKBP-type peptidyl-prolyl cis-trans isomerase [Spirochaetia bacterium]|jgi:FKBP-type peptidyl-prolyl cis-trans isomerase|nr:FKBP-type peptidyl-prolyl cis-trans isomerase [Spirochaetia bacterium]